MSETHRKMRSVQVPNCRRHNLGLFKITPWWRACNLNEDAESPSGNLGSFVRKARMAVGVLTAPACDPPSPLNIDGSVDLPASYQIYQLSDISILRSQLAVHARKLEVGMNAPAQHAG